MRKRAALALLMVLVLMIATGCSLIVKDETVDRSTEIVKVGEEVITKGDIADATDYLLDQQEQQYSYYSYYYGYNLSFDRTDADTVAAAQEEAITELIENQVLNQKMKELGFDVITEEEEANAQTEAEEEWASYLESVQTIYFSDTELTGDELTAAVEAETETLLGASKDYVISYTKESTLATLKSDRLREYAIKDVVVSDDEVNAQYASELASAKESYADDANAYPKDLMNDNYIYCIPAGYRYVKHILIQFSDEDQTAISDAEDALTAKETELTEAESELTSLQEGTLTVSEGETLPTEEELKANIETLTAEKTALDDALTAAKEAAYAAIQPTVDEVLSKLAEGEDFDALIEAYGCDSGMTTSPTKETGYAVSESTTTYVTEFQEAAMALSAVGDVSEPVKSDADSGIHIIKYIGDSVEQDVAITTEKFDEIKADLLSTKQDETYDAAVEQWISEANIEKHLDRLN